MQKPKCETCNYAMKHPYERTGASGKWESLRKWWYCGHCNKMNKIAYEIPKEISKYMDSMAAKKFPVISRIREELNAEYVDIDELEDSIEKYHQKEQPYWNIEGIKPRREARWQCNECGNMDLVDVRILNENLSEIELDAFRPLHCDNRMNLTIIDFEKELMQKQNKMKKQILENLPDLNNLKYIEYSLNEFALFGFDSMKKQVIKLNTTNKLFPKHEFGPKMVNLLIELLIGEENEMIFNREIESLVALKHTPSKRSLVLFKDWVDDLISIIRIDDLKNITDWRKRLWTIEELIRNWVKIVISGSTLDFSSSHGVMKKPLPPKFKALIPKL